MDDATPRQEPLEVAPDTFLIRAAQYSLGRTLSTNHNSLVIRAAEPVIVDTGMVTDRARWIEDVFSLVDPQDVRWIYLTHDDDDHSGNLVEAIERCPNATIVMSWAAMGRTCAAFAIPRARVRPVDDGETFDAGDRTLRAVRPPVYDSPYTRGLLDPTTRVYHAADAFGGLMPATPVDRVDQMPAPMWEQGMVMVHHHSIAPWLSVVDPTKFRNQVSKLAGLGAEVIVGAHTPVISGAAVERALELLAGLPSATPPPLSPDAGALLSGHPTVPGDGAQ